MYKTVPASDVPYMNEITAYAIEKVLPDDPGFCEKVTFGARADFFDGPWTGVRLPSNDVCGPKDLKYVSAYLLPDEDELLKEAAEAFLGDYASKRRGAGLLFLAGASREFAARVKRAKTSPASTPEETKKLFECARNMIFSCRGENIVALREFLEKTAEKAVRKAEFFASYEKGRSETTFGAARLLGSEISVPKKGSSDIYEYARCEYGISEAELKYLRGPERKRYAEYLKEESVKREKILTIVRAAETLYRDCVCVRYGAKGAFSEERVKIVAGDVSKIESVVPYRGFELYEDLRPDNNFRTFDLPDSLFVSAAETIGARYPELLPKPFGKLGEHPEVSAKNKRRFEDLGFLDAFLSFFGDKS